MSKGGSIGKSGNVVNGGSVADGEVEDDSKISNVNEPEPEKSFSREDEEVQFLEKHDVKMTFF